MLNKKEKQRYTKEDIEFFDMLSNFKKNHNSSEINILQNDNKFLNNYPYNFHKVAENISGKKNLKVSLSSWKTYGTFKMEYEIKELIKVLK